MIRRRLGHAAFQVVFWLVAAIILFYVLFPFYWTVKTSLTPAGDLARSALDWFPDRPVLSNYVEVFRIQPFGRNLVNSFMVAVGTVLVSLLLSAPAAYAFAKFRFMGKRPLLYVILAVSVFPQIAVLPGLYVMVKLFHLYNTWAALILSYLIFTLPFTVWTLTTFVRQIPTELGRRRR
jgi:trehalose/maltose transport system permease protein